jgi:DNA polymerase III subunit beta
MKAAALKTALSYLAQVVIAKAHMPILTSVRIKQEGDRIEVSGTDLETYMRIFIKTDTSGRFDTTANLVTLRKIVDSMDNSQIVTFEPVSSYEVSVRAGRDRFTLPAIDGAEFPTASPWPEDTNPNRFVMRAEGFRELFSHVGYAMATDDTRAALNGAQFEANPGQGIMVWASDGRRAARFSYPTDTPSKAEGFLGVVPKDSFKTLSKICVSFGQANVLFEGGSLFVSMTPAQDDPWSILRVEIEAKLVQAVFPDMERVMVRSFVRTATMFRADMVANIKKALILAKDKDADGLIKVRFDGYTSYFVESDTPLQGKASIEGDCDLQGVQEPFSLGCNGHFLSQALSAIGQTEVDMRMNDSLSMFALRPHSSYETDEIHLIMPVRIKAEYA